ncbi:MAG: sodium:proton antiporter [Planctomycetes bacterium]|nr:sodium:proton antiporter [Planctomycetota bacterium]
MLLLDAAAILLALAAAFGLLNHHTLKLPFTIGLLLAGLLASVGVLAADALWPALGLAATVRGAVLQVDFAASVLSGMLSLLLFAGALHTDFGPLRRKFGPVLLLATVGTLLNTALAAAAAWLVLGWFGVDLPVPWCIVFGALISPTDPIAVLGIMKAAKAPKDLETKVIGESLFNDGTGVVLFTLAVGLALAGGDGIGPGTVLRLLGQEVVGGVLLGLLLGWVGERALRSLDEPNLEVLITLAVVFGIGFVASRLHVSAPLAAVVAGLWLGNRGRARAMSDRTALALDTVWTFIDEVLNAVLFLLIGIEVLAIDYSRSGYLGAAAVLIPTLLGVRWLSVALPLRLWHTRAPIGAGTIPVLTWGGLKGGISIALAMKTPEFPGRNAVLTVTYAVVVFSIVVQGLTVGWLIRRVARPAG